MYRNGIDDFLGYEHADDYATMNEMAASDLIELRSLIAELDRLRVRASNLHRRTAEDLVDMIDEAATEAARIEKHAERAWGAEEPVDDRREHSTHHAVYHFELGHPGAR